MEVDDPTTFETHPFEVVIDDPVLTDEIVEVYRSAFSRPPWNETADQVSAYRERMRVDCMRPDARLLIARRPGGRVVGFATTWRTTDPFPATPSWYATVAEALGSEVVSTRMAGRMELDEIAVHSTHLGRGVGASMLAHIAPVDGPPVWLATSRHATAAIAMYQRAGWDELSALASDGSEVVVFATPNTVG